MDGIRDIEDSTPRMSSRSNYFKYVCGCLCIYGLLIFIFLFGKYNVQELHMIDDVIRVVFNKTSVDEV